MVVHVVTDFLHGANVFDRMCFRWF